MFARDSAFINFNLLKIVSKYGFKLQITREKCVCIIFPMTQRKLDLE